MQQETKIIETARGLRDYCDIKFSIKNGRLQIAAPFPWLGIETSKLQRWIALHSHEIKEWVQRETEVL